MTSFVAEFAASVNGQRSQIRSLFSAQVENPVEERLTEIAQNHWHAWPTSPLEVEQRPAFAVDGSGAIRFFGNGTCML